MKERLDLLLRVIAIGYSLLFVITLFVLSFTVQIYFFHMIDEVLFYDSFSSQATYYSQGIKGLKDTPYQVLITIAVLFGIRWLIFGKTYQK